MKYGMVLILMGFMLIGAPLYAGNGNLYVNGNLGVGTTSPNAPLQIGTNLTTFGTGNYTINDPVGALIEAPAGADGTVVTGLLIDSNQQDAFNQGVAIEMGFSHPQWGHYTSRIVNYGNVANTVGSRLQIQTHTNSSDIWNSGIFMNELGNVGIGTTSPNALLQLGTNSTTFGTGNYTINKPVGALIEAPAGADGTVVTGLLIDSNQQDAFNQGVAIEMGFSHPYYGHYTSRIVNFGNVANTVGSRLQIQTHTNAGDVWNSGIFMNELGNVGIGKTTPVQMLDVAGTVASNGVILTSDAKFKKNLLPIAAPLNKILGLSGHTYEWKTSEYKEKNFPDGRHYGVIAQEIETILPEVVNTDAKGEKSVAYTEIIPVLIEAFKEQQTMITNQQNIIAQQQTVLDQQQKLLANIQMLLKNSHTSQTPQATQ